MHGNSLETSISSVWICKYLVEKGQNFYYLGPFEESPGHYILSISVAIRIKQECILNVCLSDVKV